MKTYILLISFLLAAISLPAQTTPATRLITGKITDKRKYPIDQAVVFIPGVGMAKTNSNGQYSLNITNCRECRIGTEVIVRVNSSSGMAERKYVIPTSLSAAPCDIEIQNNKKLFISGVVRDQTQKRPLSGIRVTASVPDFEIPTVVTDNRGLFQIILRTEGISQNQPVKIVFSDPGTTQYCDQTKQIYIDDYNPFSILMEVCGDRPNPIGGVNNSGGPYKLSVSTYTKSKIRVEPGDDVTIRAGNSIRVSSWMGASGPEGLPNGSIRGNLADYNYFTEFNHGALLYRFGENDDWKCYDAQRSNRYQVQSSGFLEFGLNDKDETDNSGAYQVEVIVRQ